MDFWGTFWSTVLALLVVGAVSYAAVRLRRAVTARIRDRRAAFTLEVLGSTVRVVRVGGSVAYEVKHGDGIVGSSPGSLGEWGISRIGDMARGDERLITLPNDTGAHVWLSWIEARGRAYTKSVMLQPGSAKATVRAIYPTPTDPIQT